jgi:hypothetical protein
LLFEHIQNDDLKSLSRGHKEWVKDGEYGRSTLFIYENGAMRPVETVLRREWGGEGERHRG